MTGRFMLNHKSPIPLYRQLADLLSTRIDEGQYVPGHRIPSEPQLAAAFGIGRPTVRQAVEVLVQRGLVTRRRGSGTYVCEPRQEVDLFSLDGTSASFRKQGMEVNTRIIKPIRIISVEATQDNPFQEHRAFFLSRLTLVNSGPVLMEDIFLDPDLFKGIDQMDLEGRSLSTIAEERYYLKPVQGRQSFLIDYADQETADLLGVEPQTPLLMVRRFLHFTQKDNGVFVELWCRTDRFVFSQHIEGVYNG